MALLSSFPLTIEENADMPSVAIQRWVGGYPGGTLFNFTGYTASWMFRVNISDGAPILTLTPVFSTSAGGTYTDTLTLALNSANSLTIVAGTPGLSGYQDVMLISAGGLKSYLSIQQPYTVVRAVTR